MGTNQNETRKNWRLGEILLVMKDLEKKLDIAFQKLAEGKRCHFCQKPAGEIHHLITRSEKRHRWDKRNALPLCRFHHYGIHNGTFKSPEVEFEREGLREYLTKNNLIYREFLEAKAREFGIAN